MEDTTTIQIAKRVKGVAAEHGLSQPSIASIIGLGERKAVGARLAGRVPFTAVELYRFAAATGEDIGRFFPPPRHQVPAHTATEGATS